MSLCYSAILLYGLMSSGYQYVRWTDLCIADVVVEVMA